MGEHGILITDKGEQVFFASTFIKKMTLEQVNELRIDIHPKAKIIVLRPLTAEEIKRARFD